MTSVKKRTIAATKTIITSNGRTSEGTQVIKNKRSSIRTEVTINMMMALEEDRSYHPNPVPIGYINAHATSTPKGDQIEAAVVDRVLRSNPIQADTESICYMSSTKGQSGHLLGAAGALEAAFTIMSLVDQRIPPTLNLNQPENIENHCKSLKINENIEKSLNM